MIAMTMTLWLYDNSMAIPIEPPYIRSIQYSIRYILMLEITTLKMLCFTNTFAMLGMLTWIY